MVLDLSNTGKIDSPRQFELTAWDPSAKTDMQALKDVFATSHNGKLDAGDADWASFKVMVTNPDGTTTLEGLSQLGITSIDLTDRAAGRLQDRGADHLHQKRRHRRGRRGRRRRGAFF
jgi:hypothetical protein